MKEYVHLDGLLFTHDTQVVSVMNQILETFAIQTEVEKNAIGCDTCSLATMGL